MTKQSDEQLDKMRKTRLWHNKQSFHYRIPTTEVDRAMIRLDQLQQSDSHTFILYERVVNIQANDDGHDFYVKTLRRYGSNSQGGYPTISAQLEASIKRDGNVEGIAYWSNIALVRAIGITILASIVLGISIFIMEWSVRNFPLIIGWVLIVLAFPAYFWVELWWDVYALIRDVRRKLAHS